MSRDQFMIEDLDYLRLKFLVERDSVDSMILLFDDGSTVRVNRGR